MSIGEGVGGLGLRFEGAYSCFIAVGDITLELEGTGGCEGLDYEG